MGGAADVALMGADDGPEQPLVAFENRNKGGQIGQMAAAIIGIVEQKDVARLTSLNRSSTAIVAQEERRHGPADVGLGDQAPARIANPSEKSRLELRICEKDVRSIASPISLTIELSRC